MKETILNKLRQWALMADVLVSNHYSHERRWQRVQVIKRLIIREARVKLATNSLPLWADTLVSILDASEFNTGIGSHIDHTDAKNTLRLFSDTCHYIVQKYDDMWFDWAKEEYDYHTGDVEKKPTHYNPFTPIEDDNQSDDDDDSDPFDFFVNEIEF